MFLISLINPRKWQRETTKFYDGDGKLVTVWEHEASSEQGVSESLLYGKSIIKL